MARKNIKKRVQEDPRVLQARHKRDYIARLKLVSDQLVGLGWFEKIPKIDIDLIYEKRYPPINMRLAPDQIVDEKRWNHYHKAFLTMVDKSMVTVNGGKISMRTMLCEGLSLLHFVDVMEVDRFPGSETLREIFKPLLLSTQRHYWELANELSYLLFLLDARNGNYYDGFLLADTTYTNIGKVPLKPNTIFVHLHKPVRSALVIHGSKRDIILLSRPVPSGQTIQVTIKPSDIGFVTTDDDALPLYIQQHALHRLDERLGLLPDVVHGQLFFNLFQQPINYVKEDNHSLIPLTLHKRKVGYLLTTIHDQKLLIRSFLFLTNDGTPEGRTLRKLTRLEKFDKKYLGIDKLSTFNAYHIDKDEELSALFRKAGCASLLEAGYLEVISTSYTPDRDTAALSRYLDTSAYFDSL